ncbi:MAG: RNA methyltransferase, partial [Clostridium sp.]|nr:RNA methyltransferase [Clostridium sp.]
MANVIEITDFSSPELDVYARLTEAQLLNRFEPAKGLFIAESPKVIHRALDGGCVPVSMLMERKDIDGSAAEILSRCPEIPVYTADEDLLCK